jgi:(p)ppGpp synthase/HD superfamily hydrolase
MVLASVPTFVRSRPLTEEALAFGLEAHGRQVREADAAPFILHPLEVAWLLAMHGFDDEVTAAAVLHDVLEETGASCDDLEERFGDRVASLVGVLTEDEDIEPHDRRKAELRRNVGDAQYEAAAIFAADKVSKVRELRIHLSRDPDFAEDPSARSKLLHYRRSVEMLRSRLGEHALVGELSFELEMLESLPPHGLNGALP